MTNVLKAQPARQPPRLQLGGDAKPSNHKRLDLQGLRAVAVLLVALNHSNVPFLKGGYIGVDVFFVLSGYFITGILLREGFGKTGTGLGKVLIPDFYARRARRILPAAGLTLIATSIAVYIVYDLDRNNFLATKTTLDDALSATFFFANFHFAHGATNYFQIAATSLPSPFQHFWSLSVEEQVYVVWPTVLASVFFLCRRGLSPKDPAAAERRRAVATWVCAGLMLVLFVASLIYSIVYTNHNPKAAYFSTPARVYEFAIGALLSLLATKAPKLPARPMALLGCVGLAMIIVAGVTFNANTTFPGLAALLPSAGAGLVILGGMAQYEASVATLLAFKPMTWIGDRSYAFYLWHYPVLVVIWTASGHELGWGENIGLIAGALALSAVTYALIENPLRFAKVLQRGWRTAVMAAASIGLSLLAILIPISAFDSTLTAQAKATQKISASVGEFQPAAGQSDPTSLASSTPIPVVAAAVKAVKANQPLPKTMVPAFSQLQTNTYDTPGDCQPAFGPGVTPAKLCRLGDPNAKKVVVMIGDSHSGHWDPAVIADAKKQHFAMVTVAKSGCQLSVYDVNHGSWPCANWYKWALAEDKKLHPVATIVSFLYQDSYEAAPAKYVANLQTILGQVTNPILIADFPYQSQQPSICLTSTGATMSKCSTRVPSTYTPFVNAIQTMATENHVPVIPTLQWFCADGICPMVVDKTIVVHDKDHMTEDYVDDLTHVFSLALNPILKRYEGGHS